MSGLISLWKKHHDKRRSGFALSESTDSAASHISPLHRKIHPDLDTLVAQLADHRADESSALPPSTVQSAPDFIPLKPRVRRRPYSVPLHPRPLSSVVESQDIPKQDGEQSTTAPTAPPVPGDAWSTFGRGRPSHTSLENIDPLNFTPGTFGSRNMRRNTQLRTPTSASQSTEGSSSTSRSIQTRSRGSPSSHNDTSLNAHRPERYSSPSSYHTFGRHMSSPHVSIERPPPLPPLDHPAFQSLGYRRQASSSNVPSAVLPGKRPRHFSSLPSMSTARPTSLQTISGTSKYIRSAKRAHRKTSLLHQIDEPNDIDSATRVLHPIRQANLTPITAYELRSRSSGKCRRSGQEYSYKQAYVSINPQESRNGEVQDSREGTELQCQTAENNDLSELGNSCGENVSYRQVSRLGNPIFLLQDPHHHTVPQPVWHEDNNDLLSTHDITISGKGKAKANEMTQLDAFTHHSSNQGKEKDMPPRDTRRNGDPAKSPNRLHSPSSPKQDRNFQSASAVLLVPPSLSLTSPTPETTPVPSFLPIQPLPPVSSSGSNLATSPPLKPSITRTSGKRKADEVEVEAGTQPKDSRKEHRATFAPEQRPHRVSENSGSSHAPSSYRRKRARLSTSSDSRNLSRTPSIMSSLKENLNAGNTGSWPSRASTRGQTLSTPHHQPSRQSMQSQRPSNQSQSQRPYRESSRRRSLSGASIPISALVSPQAPSISRSTAFHMHDPRKPGPIQSTGWILSFPSRNAPGSSRWEFNGWVERGGTPIHAWLFFLGFLIFPIWWFAAFIGIPKTRRIGAGETEKGVVLDDPQVEHDSKTWRTRCRVMSIISVFTYIPFIILVAIFARR